MRPIFASIVFLTLVGVACGGGGDKGPGVTAAQICAATAEPTVVVDAADIIEASGIAASRWSDRVLWVHNDSGDTARFFAIDRTTGHALVTVNVAGAEAIDWEDMAIGPGPDPATDYLYVADIGDNGAARPEIAIYRLVEMEVFATSKSTPSSQDVSRFDRLTLEYPDHPHDAETFMVDPDDGSLYIVTKELATNVSSVFRAPGDLADGSTTTLEKVAEINFGKMTLAATPGPDAPTLVAAVPLLPTGGDISPDGSLIAIRTYGAVWIWDRAEGESVADAFSRPPCEAPSALELQGEAIAFDADGRGYLTTSEGANPPLHHFVVP